MERKDLFMRIPRRFKIRDEIWKVKFKANLKSDEGEELHGLCDFDKREIHICKGMSKELQDETCVHEFLHASLYENHISIDRDLEETIVDGLANCLLNSFDISIKFRPKKKKA